jgi:lipoprotein NlpI
MNEFMQALHFATQALELDPNNPKALYRKGIQNIYLQNFNDAHKDLLKAYQIDP